MGERLLAFDIWGDYGYFRRGYTTTSTISYPFPSRTTISGLISAILGLERDSYYDIFDEDNSKIGIGILNPIKKVNINLNYLNTKSNNGFRLAYNNDSKRVRVSAQFLKNPKYRIYVSLTDKKLMESLFTLLNEHKSIYTPYLGISECLANFELVGNDFFNIKKQYANKIDINSVVLKNDSILIERNKQYGLIRSPGFINSERIVTKFIDYYYEKRGDSIKLSDAYYYPIGEDNVILF